MGEGKDGNKRKREEKIIRKKGKKKSTPMNNPLPQTKVIIKMRKTICSPLTSLGGIIARLKGQ